jgi:opacity protein-like surface antigen
VVGVELEYTHMMDKMVYQDSFSDARRRDRGGFSDAVSYNVSARGSLADYGILKLRAGYPMGRFLPFATIGLVVGEQRLSGSYNSSYTEYLIDPVTGGLGAVNVGPVARNASSSKTGFNIGAAFGLGIDWAVLDNFMLRAEYQYIAMSDYKGMETTANAFRLGAGVKY